MFKIRFLKPIQADWLDIQRDSVEDAIHTAMELTPNNCLFVHSHNHTISNETVFFAVVEVEGHGKFVGRYFYAGIGRKGGVKRRVWNERDSIEDVEEEFQLQPGELLEDGWQGEETVNQAWNRKFNRNR